MLSDVLDVTSSQESSALSKKLQNLPTDEQRRITMGVRVMIVEAMMSEKAASGSRSVGIFPVHSVKVVAGKRTMSFDLMLFLS